MSRKKEYISGMKMEQILLLAGAHGIITTSKEARRGWINYRSLLVSIGICLSSIFCVYSFLSRRSLGLPTSADYTGFKGTANGKNKLCLQSIKQVKQRLFFSLMITSYKICVKNPFQKISLFSCVVSVFSIVITYNRFVYRRKV